MISKRVLCGGQMVIRACSRSLKVGKHLISSCQFRGYLPRPTLPRPFSVTSSDGNNRENGHRCPFSVVSPHDKRVCWSQNLDSTMVERSFKKSNIFRGVTSSDGNNRENGHRCPFSVVSPHDKRVCWSQNLDSTWWRKVSKNPTFFVGYPL